MDNKKKEKEEIEEIFEQLQDGEQDEEELSKFFQQLEKKISKRKNNSRIAYMLGFMTSPSVIFHFLITLILNFSIMFALQGFFNLVQYDKMQTFVFAIGMLTVAEFIVKMFFIRYFLKFIITTMGIIFLALLVAYVVLLDIFYPNFGFESQSRLVIFIVVFWLIRYAITRLLITYINNRLAKNYIGKEQE